MDCPDLIVSYNPKFNEHGIPVRTGEHGSASSYIQIDYCPWCGARLSASKRDEWFDELEKRGLDPEDDLPSELTDERWWTKEQ